MATTDRQVEAVAEVSLPWVIVRHLPRLGTAGLARLSLAAGDLLALGLALAVAVGLRVSVLPALSAAFSRPTYPLSHYFGLWWLPVVYLVALWHAGLYTRRDPFWEETRRCASGVTAAAVLIFAVLALAKVGDDVSRPVVVVAWAVLLGLLPLARWASKRLLVRLGPWRQRVLLVGGGAQTARLAEALGRAPTLGYEVVGVTDDPAVAPERALAARASDVIIAAPQMDRAAFLALVERLRPVAENVLIAPDLSEMPVLGVEVVGLFEDRALLLRVPNNLLRPWNLAVKRAFDLTAGALLGLAVLPVLLAAAVAVRATSPGPVLHVEPRVGRGRRLFPCFKLRTMYTDADERLAAHLRAHPGAAEEWERYWKLRGHDPRVTPVGRWLRRYGLDELPQLLHVLRGEMSLVGPRPYLPRELPLLAGDGMLDVRPGLTGLWQVSGKNALDYQQRVSLDRWYVNNWSLWLDVIILAKTVPALVRGDRLPGD
ncbi:MAG: exopolysaccharide biosynthesis polyprenyl glycosylphosphotransferase [Armatimonadota bacterium]|nr:exopolysaccharide biosynthesis polyprenyl glycosylphosphotransferase [Armatimonadota bacterium]MDR7537081.1 exopolysaccharide biosynthesis polyprenyl glycosylphosphotransferase [Armatimonadota bacterium]